MNASRLDYVVASPFIIVALGTLGFGVAWLAGSHPSSWRLAITLMASVMICSKFRLPIGRVPGLPVVGVTVTMLAIQPTEIFSVISVCIWAIGLFVSQLVMRPNVLQALYATGLSSAAAFAFVSVQHALAEWGAWKLLSFLVASLAYFAIALFVEFIRQGGRWSREHSFGISGLSAARIAGVVGLVGVTATIMNFVESAVIPLLEANTDTSRAPFVLLLAALLFYLLAQRAENGGTERRLRAVVDAAVELPRESSAELAAALQHRAQVIVLADEVQIRDRKPEYPAIGAEVSFVEGAPQFLVASRKIDAPPFSREDERVLHTLAHLATEIARAQQEVVVLERRANSDPLTDLPNYGAFQQALNDANEYRQYHEGIAVLFLDLDNFKNLNDTLGHQAGDDLLRVIADRLRRAAGGGDFVARVGGDEFVVILTGLVSIEQAKDDADRIVAAICTPLELEGHGMRPVVSAGLAFSSHRELDPRTLVVDADRTMLQAKRSRRQDGPEEASSVSVSSHRSTRTNDIVARAIRDDRLALAFQPIVNIEQSKIWAFEALVRYVDPELGPISPPSLVARAKSLGLMNELTMQIITKALDAAEEFRKLEPSIDCMTVNLELNQICDGELQVFILEAARAHPDISLCIELNERSLRFATDDLMRDAEFLQKAGVRIALDDYGSDDSSVSSLVRFPMDILKIDKSLIDNLADPRQQEVIKAMQGFGNSLDYTVIVEGVETPAMVEVMTRIGVRNAQGYFYGKPVSQGCTKDRLKRWGSQAIAS